MPDEVLASRLLDAISAVTRIGGEQENTSIVPGILVVDSAPNDLPSGYIKIQNPRDGTYVPCLLVSGLVVQDNDFVNVLFTKGTEPIALSQSPGSPSSGVKVSEVWESDFGAVAGSADASGNWTWQNDVTLNGGDLIFSGVGQINATGGIGFDGNGAGTFNALIIDANDDVIVNNSQGGANFLVRGDGGMSLFFVDATNELVTVNESGEDVDFRVESDNDANAFFVQGSDGFVGIGTNSPALKLEVSSSGATARFTTSASGGVGINQYYQPNTTDGNQLVFNFLSDTTGVGAATEQLFGQIIGRYDTHNHATRTGSFRFTTLQNGSFGTRVQIGAGMQVGAPTGGDKGAGTINVSSNIYLNNSAYTNPDFVLEHWAKGYVELFRDSAEAKNYPGLMPLDELSSFLIKNLHLPGRDNEPSGIFDRADLAQRWAEELHLYVLQLHERIKELENGYN